MLIPLGGAAFESVGRNPLAGVAAAFAVVAAGFGVNFLITPLDGILTEITNDAAGGSAHHIDLAANLYFGIGPAIFVAFVLTFISAWLVERRRDAWATLAVVAAITLLTAIPGAPLRNPVTGKVIGDSPFTDSLIFIIMLIFFAAGIAFGRGARAMKGSDDVIKQITTSWSSLAGLLFPFLLIAQFIVSIIVDLIIPQAIAKWALLVPIFVPLFIRLGFAWYAIGIPLGPGSPVHLH